MFWDQQYVVTLQNGYHGPHFRATICTNQGGLISPTLFNLIIGKVVWKWLAMMVEDQLVAQEGLVIEVGRCMGLFYADNIVV